MNNKEKDFWTKENILKWMAYLAVSLFSMFAVGLLIALAINAPEFFAVLFVLVFGIWGILYLVYKND